MAIPAGAIVKAAVTVVTNKKLRNIVGGIVLGIIIIIIAPIVIISSIIGSTNSIDWKSPEIIQQIESNLTEEQKKQLKEFEMNMLSIESEIKSQKLNFDPIQAQVIYLCVLSGKEKDNPDFYTEYISCYENVQNDDEVFQNISDKFNVNFTEEEKQQIITMYTKAIESQKLTPNNIHNEIGTLIKDVTTPLSEGDFLSLFHDRNWKVCVTSGYGKRVDPVTGKADNEHTGLDLGAPLGTPIFSVKSGKVLFVRYQENGYGKYIAIDHGGGYVTLYAHCSEILVYEGDEVTTDTIIAKVGSTGKSTGNHCHFEIIYKGQPENPKRYLK